MMPVRSLPCVLLTLKTAVLNDVSPMGGFALARFLTQLTIVMCLGSGNKTQGSISTFLVTSLGSLL